MSDAYCWPPLGSAAADVVTGAAWEAELATGGEAELAAFPDPHPAMHVASAAIPAAARLQDLIVFIIFRSPSMLL
jgi:hypothetical protein